MLTKLQEAEKEVILETLISNYFNVSKSAKELGVSRGFLTDRIDLYQLMPKRK